MVGFKNQDIKYTSMSQSDNEYLSIAMDKIDRLERRRGKLRLRVWSNCYFIFHSGEIEPLKVYKEKVNEIKKNYPFLFVRSYVYFIFVDISNENQSSFFSISHNKIESKNYKIWLFNSNYEVKEETRRKNIFDITLHENKVIDDYVYLANPNSELQRMEAANSDAIDCVRAFTGNLELLEQTSNMLDVVRAEFKANDSARVIVEGPARSGKTIIAATLLGEYKDAKFLLMNYFFYQALVDGFHALSGWSAEKIEELVKNPELDLLVSLKNTMPDLLKKINVNLGYAIRECDTPKRSKTKQWLTENISEFVVVFEKLGFEKKDLFIVKPLMSLRSELVNISDDEPFIDIDKGNLLKLKNQIDGLLSEKYDELKNLQEKIYKAINELISNSKQKFFHHNINKKISSKLTDGCWITRGSPTISKMWTEEYRPNLIICDEVQRLGLISEYKGIYDEFDEIEQILMHSNQSFFVGDSFQMLNPRYDQGIERINDVIQKKGHSLTKYTLPESVGVPAEIGIIMKFLTNPQAVDIDKVVKSWEKEREFEIIFIKNDANQLIALLDKDSSNKKHLASPIDSHCLEYEEEVKIDTYHRKKPIITIKDHEMENFAYKFPYFCNEEIMPNYILSAYELISREVESLYVHTPKFKKRLSKYDDWYRKHLYVLFTRPTVRLVVNFDVKEEYEQIKRIVNTIKEHGVKLSVSFLADSCN